MGTVSQESQRRPGRRGAAVWGSALSVLTAALSAGSAQGLPLVLPKQSLPYLCQLNGNIGFTLICESQMPTPNQGAIAQTAVVDLSPPSGAVDPSGTFSLFVFPQDAPVIQQLNTGMQIDPAGLFQLPAGTAGMPTQVAQLNVTEPAQAQGAAGSTGDLLVCPISSLPLLGQLNPALSFSIDCSSQLGGSQSNSGAQTALVDVQSPPDIINTSEPPPMLVPVDLLPTLGQLNMGASIDIIDVTQTTAGGALLPVALVDVKQNPQPFVFPNNGPSGPSTSSQSAASNDDPGDDGGGNGGKDNGKGHQKDDSKSHGKGHQKKDDQGED